jgi:SAM-dependent methyltransferase
MPIVTPGVHPPRGPHPAIRRFFDANWADIVNQRPDGVRTHLDTERRLIRDLVPRGDYRAVLEVGCGDGSLLLPEVAALGVRYIGIDLAEEAVAAAERRAAELRTAGAGGRGVSRRAPDITLACADIAELPTLAPRLRLPGSGLLVAFPFNVFGNLPEPWTVVADVAALGADLVIGTYDTTPAASALRAEYYRACGLRGAIVIDERVARFRSGAFRSDVYRPAVLRARLTAHGYAVTQVRHGTAGLLCWAVRPH